MSSRRAPSTVRILLVVIVWTLTPEIAPGTDLRVLPASARPDGEVRLLQDHLRPLVHAALDRRLQAYEALKTPEQIRDYRERLRAEFIQSLGGFPERTPLRPRVVGRLAGDGFRAEKKHGFSLHLRTGACRWMRRWLLNRVDIRDSIDSWRRVVESDITVDQLENTVHGALRRYDLGDLARLAGKDLVVFNRTRTASGALLESE